MEQLDFEAIEAAETSIDVFIERRAQRAKADEERLEMWRESVREHNRRQQAALKEAWREYHLTAAANLEATAADLAARHRAKAAALEVASLAGEEERSA